MAHDPALVGERSHLLLVRNDPGLTWTVTFRVNNSPILQAYTIVDNGDNTYDLQVVWGTDGDWVITATSSDGLDTRYTMSVVSPTSSTVTVTTGTSAVKSNYLALINKVLKRISQSTVTTIPTEGKGGIIAELINEAQNYLYTEVNWYSLYASRVWKTKTYTSATITFNSSGTIVDTDAGFTFPSGCDVLVTGSTYNNYVFQVSTATSSTLTLTSDELIVDEGPITATLTQVTYPVASDFGRSLSLQDVVNNMLLIEDVIRDFDASDPSQTLLGNPTNFAVDGAFYRLYPMPAGVFRYREHYLKVPNALVNTTDQSLLPLECENAMIRYAYYHILNYLQKYDVADREKAEFNNELARAKASNFKVINQLHRMMAVPSIQDGIAMPRFPATYGPRYGV